MGWEGIFLPDLIAVSAVIKMSFSPHTTLMSFSLQLCCDVLQRYVLSITREGQALRQAHLQQQLQHQQHQLQRQHQLSTPVRKLPQQSAANSYSAAMAAAAAAAGASSGTAGGLATVLLMGSRRTAAGGGEPGTSSGATARAAAEADGRTVVVGRCSSGLPVLMASPTTEYGPFAPLIAAVFEVMLSEYIVVPAQLQEWTPKLFPLLALMVRVDYLPYDLRRALSDLLLIRIGHLIGASSPTWALS
jgi:hypothetical protein